MELNNFYNNKNKNYLLNYLLSIDKIINKYNIFLFTELDKNNINQLIYIKKIL